MTVRLPLLIQRLAARFGALPSHRMARGPRGRSLGIAMAIGVVIGSGGGVMLEISAIAALLILVMGVAVSLTFNALRRRLSVSEPLVENPETGSHDPVLTPALPRRR